MILPILIVCPSLPPPPMWSLSCPGPSPSWWRSWSSKSCSCAQPMAGCLKKVEIWNKIISITMWMKVSENTPIYTHLSGNNIVSEKITSITVWKSLKTSHICSSAPWLVPWKIQNISFSYASQFGFHYGCFEAFGMWRALLLTFLRPPYYQFCLQTFAPKTFLAN